MKAGKAAAPPPELAAAVDASQRFLQIQLAYQQKLAALWSATIARQAGEATTTTVPAADEDRRFRGKAWRESAYHDYLRQAYLLGASYMAEVVEATPLDPSGKDRLRFLARQFVDMMSPANYLATNPEALQAALDSRGGTVAQGVRNLIADAEKGHIAQTDEAAFEVGRNLAATPGAVVYENPVMQLIQYAPATEKVRRRPFLIVPPCINKYYVLDLSPDASFVRWAVERGHTCFVVSWRNVEPEVGHLGWDDYVGDGILRAMVAVRDICGGERLNALGYCVGGTLLAAALAALAARGEDWVASVTFLTSLVDFSEPGELAVFISEASVAQAEAAIGKGGVKPGRDLATVFNLLRSNDLVWSYVVEGYLKGKRPEAFDILYWNGDGTNLAGPWFCWYLRNAYLENNLVKPGATTACGMPVDLGRIDAPAYVLATREDHIVPWRGAYRTTQIVGGPVRFVLGASGHIAGVVNPPAKRRRSYWTSEATPADPDAWLGAASEQRGSWWSDWDEWIGAFAGGEVPARVRAGNVRYRPIEPAPGRYVKVRAD